MGFVPGAFIVIPVVGIKAPFIRLCSPPVLEYQASWSNEKAQAILRLNIPEGEIDAYARFKDSPAGTYTVISVDNTYDIVIDKYVSGSTTYFYLGYKENGVYHSLDVYSDYESSYEHPVARFGFYQCLINNTRYIGVYSYQCTGSTTYAWRIYRPNTDYQACLLELSKRFVFTYDPYGTNENETPSGGYGNHDYTSEEETPPALPALSAANAGFVTLWNPSISEVGDLADYLWGPTFSVATWQKLWNDPMECLLSLGIVPVAPTTGTRSNIYFGNADTGIESSPITTQFVTADMGSMRIDGQSASYMDYAPYAKASIYLPYCGTYALDVDEIMDADLALEYHIDIYTGACVAYLTIDNRTNSDGNTVHNVMYQFTGNCLASIPVTSGDHSQLLQSLLFMGASIAATVATAGAASAGGTIEGLAAEGDVVASSGVLGAATAGSAINTVMSMKPNVMHSGNLSSTAGLLGGQKPFVTFTWSNLCRPDDEYQLVGMPLQKSGTLSDFEGFTIVSACHMDNILCTDAERSMIEQALGRGVII